MTARRIVSLMAIVFCCSPYVSAALTSGFETGDLTGWTPTGPVTAVTEQYARDFLGLAQPPVGGVWLPAQGSYFASLWSTDNAGANTATLSTAFDATAGEVLRFQYFFDFGDFTPDYDSATSLLTWTGGSTILFEHNTPGYELGDDENLDWTDLSYTLPVTGTYTLHFSTQDGIGCFESILGIDDVTVGAVGAVVPAPSAIALSTLGVGLLGWLRRRRAV